MLRLSLFTQSFTATVTGTIQDSSGAVVPGATIKATNTGTNLTQSLPSGADGIYRFAALPPGTYRLEVVASGF